MARPADPHARASLIAAARAEFVKKGIRGARIEDITAACGLSKGAFYLHYASKEALFGELVKDFTCSMSEVTTQRIEAAERFFAEHGSIEAHDVAERSEKYERLVAMQTEEDLRTLELMWSYRDVVHVLVRGSQGTEFESVVWGLVDREVARVTQEFQRFQARRSFRADVPPEVIGSLLVGTYVLLAQQMSLMQHKPDLEVWARSLHRLIREGSLPPMPSKPSPSKPSPRRAAARAVSRTRSTPRSGP